MSIRLLQLDNHGAFSLTEFTGPVTPSYAILSHTWGPDSDEITFADIGNHLEKTKAGYEKLRFCAERAFHDSLKYFWVDTCCINKSDGVELQHAINSMFRWYQKAERCYVYLSDLHETENDQLPSVSWQEAFRRSRWFTRGWTLQELLAPNSVEFFTKAHVRIGDKKSLEQQIHEITKIPIKALQGCPLSDFTIEERMSWVQDRKTKYEEDKVYSLQGIFDVHIPLIYGEGWKKASMRLQREIQESSKSQFIFSKGGASWIVPFNRNPNFTGRESLLAVLEEKLFVAGQPTKYTVTGLGGVGKTQLVLELVYRIKDKHRACSVIWIPATNIESLHQAYFDIARQLSIPGWEDTKTDVKKLVQSYLSGESAGQWLLVFDNADDINMWITKCGSEEESSRLINCLPRSEQGCIVFTSRDRKTAVKLAQHNVIEVPEMNEEMATQLLQKSLIDTDLINSNKADATALLEKLTYLPLAIVQAVAYINENGITFAAYLALLADQEEQVIDLLSEEFEDEWRYRDLKNPVAVTWLISFEQIRRRDTLAAEYLSFMCCVEPKDIPQSILPPGPSRKKEMEAIGTLDAYSFVTKRPTDLALDLHRLVHLSMRNWLRKESSLAKSIERVIVRLEEVFPDSDEHEKRKVWRTYLPHARYVLDSDLVDKDHQMRTDLLWRYGKCLHEDGRWNEAEAIVTEVLGIYKRVLGVDHPNTLTSMALLASTYRNQGRWDAAEELDVQVLETSKKKLGADHPDTLTSMANLASTYRNQGRWDAAEELEVQVLETSKKKLGADHPNTLTSMANLASTLWNQGWWDAAEELEVQVLETSKKKLGADHPDTLTSMANLASTLWNQGRWDAAEELDVQVLETRKKKLGADHPDTLTSMANLASTLWNQGRWDAAEELEVQVLETRKKKLGADHPSTLTSMANLASTYRNQGRWDAAEELEVQVLETRKKKLGADHPDTLTSMDELAITWRGQGRNDEALQLLEECLALRTEILGLNHHDTLSSRDALLEWQIEGKILKP
ncbi:hypothetical protein BP5796_12003 [Coleophoma crateriformis]|uniref:Uncharacterized protein n=1 Tax=Coleophoma crateriformis TaxID=565419 RepID=A0A3D8QBD2_9HELO|nr:hypothetical protein BP5796_12003 [Coleophoma crateriformis]